MANNSPFRLAFMGTPQFAVPALQALCHAGHTMVTVYSQPPKPAGRGHQIRQSPVHQAAEAMGLEVRTPRTLRDANEQKYLSALNLDMVVVAAYGLILPLPVLSAPRFGCLNIHASLLPRWRGAAPIQRAMLAGDTETGITIMQMAEGLDTGDILLIEKTAITPTTTASSLHDILSQRGALLITQAVRDWGAGKIKATPQNQSGITYATKLTREDGKISWNAPATAIERQIRALQPWPGCYFLISGEPVKVLTAAIVTGKASAPGTLLDEQFTVACGQDALRILTLQRSGKGVTEGAAFLRGLRLQLGKPL
jgi:methionyl-tRNA formyltransferase